MNTGVLDPPADEDQGPLVARGAKAGFAEAAAERRIAELEAALALAESEVRSFDGTIQDMFPPEVFGERSLTLPKTGFEESDFLRLVTFLFALEEDVRFWIGDALNQGEVMFGDAVWQALSERWSYRTIMEYRRVCKGLTKKLRLRNVDWSHFKFVVDVTDSDGVPDRDEQMRILRIARDNADWSTRDTDMECRRVRARLRGETGPTEDDGIDHTSTGVDDPLAKMARWQITVYSMNKHAQVEQYIEALMDDVQTKLEEIGVSRSEVSLARRAPTE